MIQKQHVKRPKNAVTSIFDFIIFFTKAAMIFSLLLIYLLK